MFRKLRSITIDRTKEGAIFEAIIDAYKAQIVEFHTNGSEETYIIKVTDRNWNKIEKAMEIVRA